MEQTEYEVDDGKQLSGGNDEISRELPIIDIIRPHSQKPKGGIHGL
jgi:hypothetical protein